MTARRILVIWNGRAGGRDGHDEGDALLQRVRDGVRDRGVDAEIFDSPSEDASRERIAAALDGSRAGSQPFDAIVAAGGDHTVRSVAFELLGTGMTLGILPLGTAMNIARSVDLPLDLDDAMDVLAHGEPRPIDVGFVGDQPFLEVVSIGLAAKMLDDATAVGEGRLDRTFDLLRRFIRHRRTRAWLDIDGREVRHRVLTIAIANGPFTGRALEAAPDARVDDGVLDAICYLGFGPMEMLRELLAVVFGVGSGARSARYSGRRIAVRTHHPLPVRADSADIGHTPVTISVKRDALSMLVTPRTPPSTTPPER